MLGSCIVSMCKFQFEEIPLVYHKMLLTNILNIDLDLMHRNPLNPLVIIFDIAQDMNCLMHIHNRTNMSISWRKAHLVFE